MKKEKQYVILGDNNFWYAHIVGTEEDAMRELKKYTGEEGYHYGAESVPSALWLLEVKDIAKRYIK